MYTQAFLCQVFCGMETFFSEKTSFKN
jgi:hypothetical protein